ncbi:MAG: hypothetical protein ABII72_00065 [Parcubacteria group bacterium]
MDDINDFGSTGFRWQDGFFSGTLSTNILSVSNLQGTGIVDSENIEDGTIAGDDIAGGAITGTHLAEETIVTSNIGNDAITGEKIANDTSLTINDIVVGNGTSVNSLLFGECTATGNLSATANTTTTESCLAPGVTDQHRLFVLPGTDLYNFYISYASVTSAGTITIGAHNGASAISILTDDRTYYWLAIR